MAVLGLQWPADVGVVGMVRALADLAVLRALADVADLQPATPTTTTADSAAEPTASAARRLCFTPAVRTGPARPGKSRIRLSGISCLSVSHSPVCTGCGEIIEEQRRD